MYYYTLCIHFSNLQCKVADDKTGVSIAIVPRIMLIRYLYSLFCRLTAAWRRQIGNETRRASGQIIDLAVDSAGKQVVWGNKICSENKPCVMFYTYLHDIVKFYSHAILSIFLICKVNFLECFLSGEWRLLLCLGPSSTF